MAKKCLACCSEIDSAASLCPVCKSLQRRWLNGVFHIGKAAAFLALVGSAVTFTYTKYAEAFGKDEVQVLEFSTGRGSTYANVGHGDVLLMDVTLEYQYKGYVGTEQYSVMEVVRANDFHTIKPTISKAVPQMWDEATLFDFLELSRGHSPAEVGRTELLFFSPGHPSLELPRKQACTIATIPATATLRFYSPQSKEVETRGFACEGMYYSGVERK